MNISFDISDHHHDISEEGGDVARSFDKRDKEDAQYLKELLSTNSDHSEERPKDTLLKEQKATTQKAKSSHIKADAMNLIDQKISLGDLKRGMAELFSKKQKQQQSKRFLEQAKQHAQNLNLNQKQQEFADRVVLSQQHHRLKKLKMSSQKNQQNILRQPQQSAHNFAAAQSNVISKNVLLAKQRKNITVSQGADNSRLNKAQERYVVLFSQSLFENNEKKKKDLQKLRSHLRELGVSHQKLSRMESQAQGFVGLQIKKELKKSFLHSLFHYDAEALSNGRACQSDLNRFEMFRQMMNKMQQNRSIGGFDFDEIKEDVKNELKQFISFELDRLLVDIRLKTTSNQELGAAFEKLKPLIISAGFNASNYVSNLESKSILQGLAEFKVPYHMGMVDSDWEKRKKQKPSNDFSFDVKNPDDKVRQQFFQLFTSPSLFQHIKLRYQLFKEKKQHQSQKQSSEKWELLKNQAKLMATYSLHSRLRHLLEERALLPELKGEDYRFLKDQIQLILKQLKRIGKPLSRSAFNALRDDVNGFVFAELKSHYLNILVQQKSQPENQYLENETRKYRKILLRLKKESKISHSLSETMFKTHSLGETIISEAA